MNQDDIISARGVIAALSSSKHLRRYPRELRTRLAAVVRAHSELSLRSLARCLAGHVLRATASGVGADACARARDPGDSG